MRKLWFLPLFLFLFFCVYAQDIPSPQGWVNDFAGVISQDYKDKLSAIIAELEEKTSAEIAVVTIDSISPYGEIEYARLLFDKWSPGKKGKDNGVLILLAIKERRWRIETGYGVEGILPDGLCGEIGRNFMVPYFKQGKYAQGLYQGVVKIAGIVSGDIKPESIGIALSKQKSNWGNVLFLILVFVTIFYILPWKVIFILFTLSCLYTIFLRAFLLLWLIIPIFLVLCFFKLLDKGNVRARGSTGYGWGGFGGGGFGGGGFGGFGGGGGGGGGAGGGF